MLAFSSVTWFKMSTSGGEGENTTIASNESEVFEDAPSSPTKKSQARDQNETSTVEDIGCRSPLAESTPHARNAREQHRENLKAGGAEARQPPSPFPQTLRGRRWPNSHSLLGRSMEELIRDLERLQRAYNDINEDLRRKENANMKMKVRIERCWQDNKKLNDALMQSRRENKMMRDMRQRLSDSLYHPQCSHRERAPQDPHYNAYGKMENDARKGHTATLKELKQELEHVKLSHKTEKEQLETAHSTALKERNKYIEELQEELDSLKMSQSELIENLSNFSMQIEETDTNNSGTEQPAKVKDVPNTTQQELSPSLQNRADLWKGSVTNIREKMLQVQQQLSDRERELSSNLKRIAELESDLKNTENNEALSKREKADLESALNSLLKHLDILPIANSTDDQVEESKQAKLESSQEKDSAPNQVELGTNIKSKAELTVNMQVDMALSRIQKLTQEKGKAHDQLKQKASKITELEQQLQGQQEQIQTEQNLSKKMESLKTEVSEKCDLIHQKERDITSLSAKLKEAKAAEKDTRKRFDDQRENYCQLLEEVKQKKEQILKLQEQLIHSDRLPKDTKEKECQSLEKDMNDLKEQLKKVRSECESKLAKKDAELEENRKQLEENLEQKQEQEQNKKMVYEQLESAMSALKAVQEQKLEEAECKYFNLVQEAEAKNKEEVRVVRSEFDSFKKLQNESRAQVESLTQRLNEALSQAAEDTSELKKGLKSHIANHQTQTEGLKGTHESKLAEMEDKINNLDSCIRNQTGQISETESHHKETIQNHFKQIEGYRKQIEELQMQDKSKEDLKKLEKDFGVLSIQMQDIQQSLSEVQEKTEQLKSSVSSKDCSIEQLTNRISELNGQLHEVMTEKTDLQKQKEELEDYLLKTTEEMKSLSEEVAKMTREQEKVVEEKQTKISDLEDSLKSSETKADRLEKELAQEKKQISEEKKHQQEILNSYERKLKGLLPILDMLQKKAEEDRSKLQSIQNKR